MSAREEALLAAVLACDDDDDDGARLAYADALGERGDPHGELIVVQCARARGDARPELIARETALLAELEPAWREGLGGTEGTLEIRRGFIARAEVHVDAIVWAHTAHALLRHPVRELAIAAIEESQVAIGDAPWPAPASRVQAALDGVPPSVRVLRLQAAEINALDVAALATSAQLVGVRELELAMPLADADADVLAAAPRPNLARLIVRGTALTPAGIEALARAFPHVIAR